MTCKEMERQNSTSNGSPNTAFLSYIKSHIYITYQTISSYGAGYIVKH